MQKKRKGKIEMDKLGEEEGKEEWQSNNKTKTKTKKEKKKEGKGKSRK